MQRARGGSGPTEAIVLREHRDWLVVTTKGRGGPRRAFFDRIAEKVVSSRNPLLLIPPNRCLPMPAKQIDPEFIQADSPMRPAFVVQSTDSRQEDARELRNEQNWVP